VNATVHILNQAVQDVQQLPVSCSGDTKKSTECKNFDEAPHDRLTDAQAQDILKIWEKKELVERETPKWKVVYRLLTGPMPIMLWIAALIELIIHNYTDLAILLFIQFANASISY